MPEGVGMNVGQIIFGAEAIQPRRNAVRIHQVSIIAGKNIAVLSPLIPICDVCLANLAGAIYQKPSENMPSSATQCAIRFCDKAYEQSKPLFNRDIVHIP